MSSAESIYYHYSYYNQRSNMKLYLVCVILITVFLLDFLNLVQGHGTHDHAHHHDDEEIQRGKQKWFKQPADQHIHDHGHAHGHDHHHDHGHGHHHDHGHDHGHVHSHAHETVHDHKHAYSKPVAKRPRTLTQTIDMWWQAIFATLLISAAPFVILFAVPLESNAAAYQPLLKVLLSFASGGLLGDAFLHLIPHAIHPHSHGEDGGHEHTHDHEHGHDHSSSTTVGLFVLAGIVAFLCIEKVVRLVQGEDHHHHHHVKADNKSDDDKDNEVEDESKDDTLGQGEVKKRISVKSEAAGAENEDQDKPSEEDEKKEEDGSKIDSKERMKVAGYLNLAADFAHNFTDGLAIGASFLGGQKLGFITTLTILFHEVPHEIGDFAILVQSGCTKKKAMFLQLSTATGALAGCVLGLLAEHVSETTTAWILPFTAGGFIYIATVSVIPELLQDSDIRQTCKEIVAMLTGIVMMVVIAMMEH